MNKEIATIAKTKAIMDKFKLYPNKGYGQNFIIEPRIVQKIAAESFLDQNTAVIEIGPGIGALTEQLALIANEVLAFEIDKKLIGVLEETLSVYHNITVLNEDFLECQLVKHFDDLSKRNKAVVVVANLPYYITTPIIFKIVESMIDVKAMTLMVQKEIADRFLAKPNTKDYNALSVILQYLYQMEVIMKVSPFVFIPKPAVDSVVIRLVPQQRKKLQQEKDFFLLVKACFNQRRKTINNNLKGYLNDQVQVDELLQKADIAKERRAESLSMSDFLKLYEVMYEG